MEKSQQLPECSAQCEKLRRHTLSWRMPCYDGNMKIRLFLTAAIILSASVLYASYSVVLPYDGESCFEIIGDDGESILLDDYIWSKRWNGLHLERMGDHIYMITDDDGSIITAGREASQDELEDILDFWDASTLITEGIMPPHEALDESGVKAVVTTSRESGRDLAVLDRLGIDVIRAGRGDVIEIDDAVPEKSLSSERILVTCPECGSIFALYL